MRASDIKGIGFCIRLGYILYWGADESEYYNMMMPYLVQQCPIHRASLGAYGGVLHTDALLRVVFGIVMGRSLLLNTRHSPTYEENYQGASKRGTTCNNEGR